MAWLFGRSRRDLDEEIRAHLAMAERDRVDRGEAPDTARASARREFGNLLLVKEVTHDVAGYSRLDSLWGDVRHSLRRISHRPATSVAAVLMIGVAVGLATAMFAVTDALLLRPVPFHEPERLLWLFMGDEHGGSLSVSPAVVRAWRETPAFEAAETALSGTSVVDADAGPDVVASARVTPGLFSMLGVRALRGRLFDTTAGVQDESSALISEQLWRTALRSDPDVVGRLLTVDGRSRVVIGVVAGDVRFPTWNTRLWLPLATTADGSPAIRAMAFLRTARGIQLSDALRLATDRAHAADPSTTALRALARPLAGGRSASYRQLAIRLLAGGVVLVGLVLLANVCSLLLARFTARRREFALCAILGASRARLIRQALVESSVLAGLGTVVGTALAWLLVRLAGSWLPEAFLEDTLNPLSIDGRTFVAAAAVAVLATLMVGLIPAIMATRRTPASATPLQERGGTESRLSRTFTRSLLVAQVALACTLLVGGSLLIRSFLNIAHVDRGFDPHGLVALYLTFDRTMAPDPPARRAAMTAVAEALRSTPGVSQLAISGGGPMTDANNIHFGEWRTDVDGAAPANMEVEESVVSAEFFSLYGLRLIKGRLFEAADTNDVAVVGETIARLWPDNDPIGHVLAFPSGKWQVRIVGVVKETNRPSLDAGVDRADLFTLAGPTRLGPTITLRCGDSCPNEAVIRQQVRGASPSASVFRVTRLEEAYDKDLAQPRATAIVGGAFGVVALSASAAGLFSVLSAAVIRRRREFGIRAAIGASPGQLRRNVLMDGMAVTLVGLGFGSIAAYVLMAGLSSLQYGVTIRDPLTWASVIATISSATLAACWWPARQAMRTDPAALLREE